MAHQVARADLQADGIGSAPIVSKILRRRPARSVCFCFDVYCVPVARQATLGLDEKELQEEKDRQELKAIALARMSASYSWARYVLVLDRELSRSSGKGSLSETLARVAMSGWNTRCWTYQESVRAKQIVVPFRDTLRVLFDDRVATRIGSTITLDGTSLLQTDIAKLTHQSKQSGRADRYIRRLTGARDRSDAFIALCNTVYDKTTARSEDMNSILLDLLELSTDEISKLNAGGRMKAILGTVPSLPIELLLGVMPRPHQQAGSPDLPCKREDRWILTRFLHTPMEKSTSAVHVMKYGLYIKTSAKEELAQVVLSQSADHKRHWVATL